MPGRAHGVRLSVPCHASSCAPSGRPAREEARHVPVEPERLVGPIRSGYRFSVAPTHGEFDVKPCATAPHRRGQQHPESPHSATRKSWLGLPAGDESGRWNPPFHVKHRCRGESDLVIPFSARLVVNQTRSSDGLPEHHDDLDLGARVRLLVLRLEVAEQRSEVERALPLSADEACQGSRGGTLTEGPVALPVQRGRRRGDRRVRLGPTIGASRSASRRSLTCHGSALWRRGALLSREVGLAPLGN